MTLGHRKSELQEEMSILAADLTKSVGHVIYEKLNELLIEAGFDC